MTLNRNSSGSRNAGGPALGTTARGAECLDVAHRPGELAGDLGVDQLAHALQRLLVDHRVPDRSAVLQPVQIDRSVGAQRVEIVGPAVVLVDQTSGSVADDQRRVAAGTIGDARLDVDGDSQIRAERHLLAVGRADDVVETERPDLVLQLASREPGDEHRGVAVDVLGEPRLVEVIGVQVGDVEVGRVLDALHQLGWELIVAREHEPRSEERRQEPRIAEDRSVDGVDQDAGVADGGGSHSKGG